ncbi:HNH endonuclease signature motif containing protein [Propionibacteriaceae bacterium Y1700]|uniref:HNH endonuclease signature motif containing protein n=1 Tax=Microlunatus sp. Y1700 TaxID=3418487 RepID=UPI003DA702C0
MKSAPDTQTPSGPAAGLVGPAGTAGSDGSAGTAGSAGSAVLVGSTGSVGSVDGRGLLDAARGLHRTRLHAEADLLVTVARYADVHPPAGEADTIDLDRRFCRDELPLSTWGLPEVSAAAIAELASCLGLPTVSGRSLICHALQLRHRLPQAWLLLQSYELPPIVARKLAHLTIGCNPATAAVVDCQIAGIARKVTLGQVERLVTAAIVEHDPDHPHHAKLAGTHDPRGVWIHHRTDGSGLTDLTATMDVLDGLTLDAALTLGARELARYRDTNPDSTSAGATSPGSAGPRSAGAALAGLGSQPLRAFALGDLARRHPRLDHTLPTTAPSDDHGPIRTGHPDDLGPIRTGLHTAPDGHGEVHREPSVSAGDGSVTRAVVVGDDRDIPPITRPPKLITLHLHLSADALTTRDTADRRLPAGGAVPRVGRIENTSQPVTAERIREWLGDPAAKITIRPVIRTGELIHTDAYEIPNRLNRQLELTELTCVFPWCDKPAIRCDTDHTIPHSQGGPTATENLAPLCRHHHRLKTHTRWRYTRLDPPVPDSTVTVDHGPVFVWTSPYGYHYRRDRHGTTPIDWPPDDPPPDPPTAS